MQKQGQFGARLRAAREARGIALRAIADTTKISMSSLEALEHEDVSRLPGGIFSRSLVRGYAAQVGLDPEATVAEFAARFPDSCQPLRASDIAALERPRPRRNIAPVAGAAVVFVAAIVGLTLGGWVSFDRFAGVRGAASSGIAAAADVASSRPLVEEPAPPEAEPTVVVGTSSSPEHALGAEAASLLAASLPDETIASAAAMPAETAAFAAEGMPLRLVIQPVGRCWVRVVVDGKVVLARELAAGERALHEAEGEIVLTVGDAAAFAYSINDAPGRTLGGAGKVVTTRIDRSNLTTFVSS